MKFKNYQFTTKRRGLSSVVGALLFVVLMVATFAVLGVALNSQTDIVSTGRDVAEIGLKKQQENFDASITAPSEILTVDITNKGQNPVEIFTLVVTNSTQTEIHDITSDTSFIASGFRENILSTTPIKLTLANPSAIPPLEIYDIKVISSLGTIKTGTVICTTAGCEVQVGTGSLRASLFLDGPNAVNTKNTTAVMFVTNTSDEIITDVHPTLGWTAPYCDDLWTVSLSGATETLFVEDVVPCEIDPKLSQPLGPHESIIFVWDGEIQGDVGAEFKFCSQATGIVGGAPVFSGPPDSCDYVTVIDPNDCGGCGEGGATIILIDDLLIRPSLFLVIPSPFGIPKQPSSAPQYTGLWGVNVANPTETPMNVSKVTIVAFAPGANNLDVLVDGDQTMSEPCVAEDISPGDTFSALKSPETGFHGSWTCPKKNTIMWQNFTNPITIDARSSENFLVKIKPGSISGGDKLDAVIVQANVFTSSGSFGKSDYQTTMLGPPSGPLVNVYLTDTNDSRDDLQSQRLGMFSNSTQTFKIVFADMDDDDETSISQGSRLIINVPREWKDVVVTDSTGFVTGIDQPSVVEHGDSSTQIIAITDSPIGGAGDPDTKTITFTTESPDIVSEGVKRLYIMYVLADGTTENGHAVGPLNEIVLQVLPTLN